MAVTTGSRLGPYEILTPIGAGGMGEVYKARDTRLGRTVAIKILPSADPELKARFEREAKAIAALQHPHICTLYDVGHQDGTDYLVLEYLEGETLAHRVARGALKREDALKIATEIIEALEKAHRAGIVHRDLKPANVMLTKDGVKLLDFGLATPALGVAIGMDVTRAPLTPDGLVLGTVGYMAPEQLRGEPVDVRADIFALGVLLHEMLAGQPPFHRGSAVETMSAVLREQPPDLAAQAGIPVILARLVRRCLEKLPLDRFQTARDLGFALETSRDVASEPTSKADVDDRSIAVLPFANMSANADSQYFSDGLADELINALTHLPGLRVAARTSAFRFRARNVDTKEIGRALRVATVLEGTVRRTGRRLRVTAQLINVADGYQRWSERYDREMADVFEIQDDIVNSILRALAPTLAGDAKTVIKRPTENLEAYELYLKGREYWSQRSPGLMPVAIRLFERAIALDSDYTLAYAGLADCYINMRSSAWASEVTSRPSAEAALTRAMALDPKLAEVQFAQAQFIMWFERAWFQAEPCFRRAIELNPRWPMPHALYSYFLAAAYRLDEAAAQVEVALELDPLSPFHLRVGANVRYADRAYPEAEQLARRALDLQPDYLLALVTLTVTLTEAGRVAEAIPFAERVVTLSRTPLYVGLLGMVYGRAGRMDDVRHLERELDERRSRGEYVTPASMVALAIGRRDGALLRLCLGACLTDQTPFAVLRAFGPLLDAWRTDAVIDALLQQLGNGVRPPESITVHP